MALLKGMWRRGEIWWLRYTVNGKQHRVSLETADQGAASVRAIEVLQQSVLVPGGAWEAEVERFLAERRGLNRYSAGSVRAKRTVLLAAGRVIGVAPALVEARQLLAWMAGLEARGLSGSTVEGYLFILRAFFRWLVKRGKMRANPVSALELPRVERVARTNFLGKDLVRRLIAEAPSDDLRFILFCGFHAGMRKNEIIEARAEWVRLGVGEGTGRGSIHLSKSATFSPKDKEARTIPLTADFEAFLRGWGLRGPFLLRPEKAHGRNLYRFEPKKMVAEYFAAQGVRCTIHDMRRTFVSLRLIDGVSIFKLAKWTGDGVEVLQRHYGHLLSDDEDIEAGI
jgi:integrase